MSANKSGVAPTRRVPSTRPHFHGHRARQRERFLRTGIDQWPEYEVLELLLTYCIPRWDVKPVAKDLIARFTSLAGVLDAPVTALTSVTGISPQGAVLIKLCKEIARSYLRSPLYRRPSVGSPQAVADYLSATLRSHTHEELHALFLDTGNRLIAAERLHRGTVNHATVYPREILERAIQHSAAGVILAHNHPGGTGKPSSADIQTTMLVRRALEPVDIALLDHLIITDDQTFSFKQHDLL